MINRTTIFLSMSLIATTVLAAKPCNPSINRSCLKLNNHVNQAATIECSYLRVSAQANESNSTQLDLGWGDGLGAPEPRTFNCELRYAKGEHKNFHFYNPYWGSNIDFNLVTQNQLRIHVKSGWSAKTTDYTVNW